MKKRLFIIAVVAAFILSAGLSMMLSPSASAQAVSTAHIILTEGTLNAAGQYTQSSGLFFRLVSGTPLPSPTPSPTPCEPIPASPGGFVYFGTYTLSNNESGQFFVVVPNISTRAADGVGSPDELPPNPVVIQEGLATVTLQINPATNMGTGLINFTSGGTAITGNIIITFGAATPATDAVPCGTPTPTPTPNPSPTPTSSPIPTPSPTPTSTMTQVSGRVLTPTGMGLRNAVVSLTDSSGIRRTATTSSFGSYQFDAVRTGETYIIAVASKRFRFASRIQAVTGPIANLDLIGLE